MKHIPNILSSLRIVMVGIFVWLFLSGAYLWALAVYALAFFTDVLDGYLARRFHWITAVGKLLDPVADKLMIFAALVCIFVGKMNETPYLIILTLVAVQQALMILGGLVMLNKHVVVQSDWYGKVSTGIFAAGVILSLLSFPFPVFEPWNIGVLAVAVALSYIAMIHYAVTQIFARKKTDAGDAEEAAPAPADPKEK